MDHTKPRTLSAIAFLTHDPGPNLVWLPLVRASEYLKLLTLILWLSLLRILFQVLQMLFQSISQLHGNIMVLERNLCSAPEASCFLRFDCCLPCLLKT